MNSTRRPSETRRRLPPAERRTQILGAAAALFYQRGYAAVGIDDIGAAIGISGPAVYRYFLSKEQLVATIGIEFLDRLADGSEATIARFGPRVEPLVRYVVEQALTNPAEVAVFVRHLKGLDEGLDKQIISHWTRLKNVWTPALMRDLSGIRRDSARLLLYATVGFILGAEPRTGSIPNRANIDLLSAAILRMLTAKLPPPRYAADVPQCERWTRASRREQILDAAIALFRERGFGDVSMAEIAGEVGLTATATYRHFRSKEELLATGVDRAGDRGLTAMNDALAEATSAGDALEGLIRAYVSTAVNARDIAGVALTEWYHLPQDSKRLRRDRLAAIDQEWRLCLATTRPDLTSADASLLIAGIQALVVETTRSIALGRRVSLSDELELLVRAILTA